jgi:hypothetical protein
VERGRKRWKKKCILLSFSVDYLSKLLKTMSRNKVEMKKRSLMTKD